MTPLASQPLRDLYLMVMLEDGRILCNRLVPLSSSQDIPWQLSLHKFHIKLDMETYIHMHILAMFGLRLDNVQHTLFHLFPYRSTASLTDIYKLQFKERVLLKVSGYREIRALYPVDVYDGYNKNLYNFSEFGMHMLDTAEAMGECDI